MTIKIVPEQKTVICDNCKTDNTTGKFRMRAHFDFSGSALIYSDPAAPPDFRIDLCDKCAIEFFNEWKAKCGT